MTEPTPSAAVPSNLTLMPSGNGNVSVTEVNAALLKEARKQRPTLSAPISNAFNDAWAEYVALQNVGKPKDAPLTSASEILRNLIAAAIHYDQSSDPEVVQTRRKFANAEARKAQQAEDREQKKLANKAVDNLKATINQPGTDKMAALLALAKQLGIDVSTLSQGTSK